MKAYLQKDLNDPTKTKIEYRSSPDENTISEVPVELAHEDASALHLETVVEEETGRETKVLKVDAAKKAAKLKEKEDRVKDMEAEKTFEFTLEDLVEAMAAKDAGDDKPLKKIYKKIVDKKAKKK